MLPGTSFLCATRRRGTDALQAERTTVSELSDRHAEPSHCGEIRASAKWETNGWGVIGLWFLRDMENNRKTENHRKMEVSWDLMMLDIPGWW